MEFLSPGFFAFVAVVVAIFNLGPPHTRQLTLLIASYVYYASLYPPHSIVLLGVTVTAYVGGTVVRRDHRRFVAALYVAAILAPLLLFKYASFGTDIMRHAGLLSGAPIQRWLVPTGISFFTFQALGHLFDARAGRTNPNAGLISFGLFLAHFPNLLAGPIERSRRLLPQLTALHRARGANLYAGARLVLWGVFCKRVVADNLASIVDAVVAEPQVQSGLTLAAGFSLYSFQIYFDFLGYTAVAIGLARCFNLRLHRNFRRPYAAGSLREFWHRWHISLSTWFRDYVYIPLGGNRLSEPRRSTQIVGVFVLSGLWHGAGLNFLLWGALHGLGYAVEDRLRRWRGTSARNWRAVPGVRMLGIAATFAFVTIAWILFRTPSGPDAILVLTRIASLERSANGQWLSSALYQPDALWFLFMLLVAIAIDGVRGSRRGLNRVPVTRREIAVELTAVNWLAVTVVLFGDLGARDFLYFRF